MASAITDLLDRTTDSTTGRPVISALASPKAAGASSLSLSDATNWTTSSAIHFAIYETTAAGVKDPTTQTDWKGTLSTTTISNLTLTGGTDRDYSAGAKVEITPTARWAKDIYDNITVHANQDGTLKTTAVQQALNIATSSTDWTPLANTPTMTTNNGQKEHVLTYTNVDYTDRLQAGTKLRIPRTDTTPTQSMAFVSASSQYASKASPTGITFTDDFTCEAWIYLDSYPTSNSAIISRYNANGWLFSITPQGQVRIFGQNGTSKEYNSYQSVPLGKWTHVAASLDMSGSSGNVYIDGVLVPSVVTGAQTSLTQAGNLEIGSYTASNFFNGKIANARVWSTVRTAAQIRDNMNQETPASTTGLVAHFKGNGSWNDSSANANHLTAAGGALNNFASHPYSAVEYAIATKVALSGADTLVTVFSGSGSLPQETLGATSYSSARAPYGFPVDRNKWTAMCWYRVSANTGSVGSGVVTNVGSFRLTIPAGAWKVGYRAQTTTQHAGVGYLGHSTSLSTSATTLGQEIKIATASSNVTTSETSSHVAADGNITQETAATYYYVTAVGIASTTQFIRGDAAPAIIYAECAYL